MSKVNFSMTEQAIVRSYQQAAHKVQQVKTLAELNGCQNKDILRILIQYDVDLLALHPAKNRRDEVLEVLFEMLEEKDEEVKAAETEVKILDVEYQSIIDKMRKYSLCQ